MSGIDSVQLSQHFQPASDRDRVSPAESAFLVRSRTRRPDQSLLWDNAIMMIWPRGPREARASHIVGPRRSREVIVKAYTGWYYWRVQNLSFLKIHAFSEY